MKNTIETLPGIEVPAILRGACLVSEQPQARLETFGRAALSDGELLALVMQGAGLKPEDARVKALTVLAAAGSVAALASWDAGEWRAVGLPALRAAQLAAVIEMGRRMMTGAPGELPVLNRPESIAQFMAPVVAGLEVEKFWVLCLNRKNRLLKRVEITSGTATAALAHPREVFRCAIRESAAGLICVHNHPSGDPAASAADVNCTRQLREAARAVDIELLDHVICGRAGADPLGRGYFSFREAGML